MDLQGEKGGMRRLTQDPANLANTDRTREGIGAQEPLNHGVRSRGSSTSSIQSVQTQVLIRDKARFGEQELVGGPIVGSGMTVALLSAFLRGRMAELQSNIKNAPGVATNVKTLLIDECRIICQDYDKEQRLLQQNFDRICNENIHTKAQLDMARRELADYHQRYKASINELGKDKEILQSQVNELIRENSRLEKEWSSAHDQLLATNNALMNQVDAQEKHIMGKGALLQESGLGSSAQLNAVAAASDPFATPSTSRKAMDASPTPNRLASSSNRGSFDKRPSGKYPNRKNILATPTEFAAPTNRANHGPQRHPRQQTEELSSQAMGTSGPLQSAHLLPDTTTTELRSTPPDPLYSQALVPYVKDNEIAEDYSTGFAKLYQLVEGWAKLYAYVPNLNKDYAIATSNDPLWAFMMNCTYPGFRQDSHIHVMTLLANENTRYWFVMRMCITYCVDEIINTKLFHGYSAEIDLELEVVKVLLQGGGLANEARQELVNQRANAVQRIISAPNYEQFRRMRLSEHGTHLRDVLGPMIGDHSPRNEAGRDISAIAITAWELSVKLYSAPLTFQILFPEMIAKFSMATMISKDRPLEDALQMQVNQTRLKLVIAPVITLRDDREPTIKVKNLHRALVLTVA